MSGAEADSARERKTLRLLIEQTAGAVLVFCLYTRRAIRRDVTAWLRTNSSVPVQEFTLSQQTADPSTVLASFSPTPRQCFVFDEVESAFPKFLGYVNFQREQLLGSGHALLFWIREEGLRRIAEEAPDFWAWRSRVFDFRTVPDSIDLPQSAPSDPAIASYSSPDLRRQVSSLESSGSGDLVTQLALGRRYLSLNRYEEAKQSLQRATQIAQQSGDRQALAESLYGLGNVALLQKQFTEAEAFFSRSLDAAGPTPSSDLKSGVSTSLAELYLQQGKKELAFALARQAVEFAEPLKRDARLSGTAFYQMGRVLQSMRDLRTAEQSYLKAVGYAQQAGEQYLVATTLAALGRLYAEMGDTERAQQTFREAANLADQGGFEDLGAAIRKLVADLSAS